MALSHRVPTTIASTRQRAMSSAPEIAPTLVPAPVIRKAMAGPVPMPPAIRPATSGRLASLLM